MGDADEICNNPQTDYTKNLINSIPKGLVDDIKGSIERKKQYKMAGVA